MLLRESEAGTNEGASLDIANLKPEEEEEDIWKRLSPQEVTLL
jgi:hypothetical protein